MSPLPRLCRFCCTIWAICAMIAFCVAAASRWILSSRARSAFLRCVSNAARRASSTLTVPVRRSTFDFFLFILVLIDQFGLGFVDQTGFQKLFLQRGHDVLFRQYGSPVQTVMPTSRKTLA